jgi:hypothetical protein
MRKDPKAQGCVDKANQLHDMLKGQGSIAWSQLQLTMSPVATSYDSPL